jgi:hypothetical protein
MERPPYRSNFFKKKQYPAKQKDILVEAAQQDRFFLPE